MPALRRPVLACSTMCFLASCGGGSSESPVGSSSSNLATTVKVTLSDSVVTVGTVLQATASVTDASGRAVTNLGLRWSVSDSSVASIDDRGAVMGERAGNVTVTGQAFDATGRVHASGTAGARVRRAPGSWYLHDSLYVAFRGSFGTTINVRIAGNRAAVVFHGEENLYTGGVRTKPCLPVPPASVIVGPGGTLVDNTSRIVETTPSTVMSGGLLPGDYNQDGNADILINGTACDIPQPTKSQRDYPKILLGDGNGTFTDVTAQALPGQSDVNSWANDVSFADINGDGRIDIVGKRSCASTVPVLPEPPLVW